MAWGEGADEGHEPPLAWLYDGSDGSTGLGKLGEGPTCN